MEHCAVFSQHTHTSWITIHDSYFLSGNRQPSHRDTKSKLFLISAVLPADQNECEALSDRVEAALVRWWNCTSQSIPPFFFFLQCMNFRLNAITPTSAAYYDGAVVTTGAVNSRPCLGYLLLLGLQSGGQKGGWNTPWESFIPLKNNLAAWDSCVVI